MKFYPQTPLRLIELRQGVGKDSGKPYAIVKMADENTYENVTFMLHRDQATDFLQLHSRYNVELDKNENYYSVFLTPDKVK